MLSEPARSSKKFSTLDSSRFDVTSWMNTNELTCVNLWIWHLPFTPKQGRGTSIMRAVSATKTCCYPRNEKLLPDIVSYTSAMRVSSSCAEWTTAMWLFSAPQQWFFDHVLFVKKAKRLLYLCDSLSYKGCPLSLCLMKGLRAGSSTHFILRAALIDGSHK